MLENVAVFIFASILLLTAKERRALGVLVFCYYGAYIVLEMDFFGFTVGGLSMGFSGASFFYLMYTMITSVAFIVAVSIHITFNNKSALFYSAWLWLNLFITALAGISQAFETNAIILVYNILQNINLLVDIIVAIVGTDSRIKWIKNGKNTINGFYGIIAHNIGVFNQKSSGF